MRMENRFPSRSAMPTTPLTTISTRSTGKIGSTMTDPQVLEVLDHDAPTAVGGNGLQRLAGRATAAERTEAEGKDGASGIGTRRALGNRTSMCERHNAAKRAAAASGLAWNQRCLTSVGSCSCAQSGSWLLWRLPQ